MAWTGWACLGVFIAGFLLFIYGANIYNLILGFAGLYMFVGAIIAYIMIYIYHELSKPIQIQSP